MDLNLVKVFVAIYESESLRTAARRLFVTQSAVSQSLARLRSQFDDMLFERVGNGMRPTPLAVAVYPNLRDAMASVDRALGSAFEFDPSTTERVFRVALSELGEIGWLPTIVDAITEKAPHSRLEVVRLQRDGLIEALSRGTIDLAVAPANLGNELEHRLLKRESYQVMMSADHPQRGKLDANVYRRARRVAVTGDSGADLLEAVHGQLGNVAPPAVSVQHFASLPPILLSGRFIATVPETLAQGWSVHWPLVAVDCPFEPPVAELHLYRRSTTQHVTALDWIYSTVAQSAARTRGEFSTIGADQ